MDMIMRNRLISEKGLRATISSENVLTKTFSCFLRLFSRANL